MSSARHQSRACSAHSDGEQRQIRCDEKHHHLEAPRERHVEDLRIKDNKGATRSTSSSSSYLAQALEPTRLSVVGITQV